MRRNLVVTAVIAIAMVAAFFVHVPASVQAQTPGLPNGPWVNRLIWSEQENSGIALEQIKAGEGDFFMFSLQGGAEKTESFLSPEVLSFSTFGSVNALLMNPNRQVGDTLPGQQPMNPFTDAQIREAMQYLIDRSFLNLEALDGFATQFVVPFHPKQAEYSRELAFFQGQEALYQADSSRAQSIINTRMAALGATRPAGTCSATVFTGCWLDAQGEMIDIKIAARIEDERLVIGQYVGSQLRTVGFRATVNPTPASLAIPMVYGGAPDIGAWHIYTEGWAFTANVAWDDGQLYTFAYCGIGEPFCDTSGRPGGSKNHPSASYVPPADFGAASETLAFGLYTSLGQRQQLIKDLTPRTFTETNYRMWIQAEQAVFPVSQRIEGAVFDGTGGPWTTFTLKSAKLLPGQPGVDRTTGVGGDVRVLNFIMFNDAWNPWRGNWLYDSIQRQTFGDPGMWLHPNTGVWIEYRSNVTMTTAGPTGTLAVPTTALVWNSTQAKFVPLSTQTTAQVTAVSKVTSKLTNPGKWHTGQDITMDDVVYSLGTAFRRAFGDIYAHDPRGDNSISGLRFNLATARYPFPAATGGGVFKGFEFNLVDNTVTAYIDFWHVDPQEIKAAGNIYVLADEVPAPWEISEAAIRTVLEDKTAIHETTAVAKGLPRLDLGRNPTTIALVDAAFGANKAANTIPAFMSEWITAAEATARYNAAQAFRTARGHWYASNGPFVLANINPTFRQSTMEAFRDGYPFTPDHWEALKVKKVPTATLGTFPSTMLAGSAATLGVTTKVANVVADARAVTWFVRQLATGGIPIQGEAVRTGVGTYEVQVLSTLTVGLSTGGYELVVLIRGEQGSITQTVAFTVTSQLDFFSALVSEVEDRLDTQGQQLNDLSNDVGGVQTSASSLQTLVTAVLALAVIAIVVPAAMLMVILRKLPAKAASTSGEPPREEL